MSVKERILQSAEELIYQKGYVATSISDIMEAADVGKDSLLYFKSKKELVDGHSRYFSKLAKRAF